MSILLKNGTVLDYASNTNEKLDVLIENNNTKNVGITDTKNPKIIVTIEEIKWDVSLNCDDVKQ